MLRRGVLVDIGVAVIALNLGFGGWAVTHRHHTERVGIIGEASPGGPPLSIGETIPAIAKATDPTPLPGGGAPDPASAVDRYLRAEVNRDTPGSYLLLSTGDRRRDSSPAKWAQHHRSLPTIVAYRLGDTDGATVTAALDLTPSLDEFAGDIPAHADATWTTVQEGDAWYVSLESSTVKAIWPADAPAADAANRWATARQQCTTSDEFDTLVGSPALADSLCKAKGTVTVGAPERLQPADGTALIAAFGGGAAEWARVVGVHGPVELRVVLAPVGDDWLVVGVLPPPA